MNRFTRFYYESPEIILEKAILGITLEERFSAPNVDHGLAIDSSMENLWKLLNWAVAKNGSQAESAELGQGSGWTEGGDGTRFEGSFCFGWRFF